MHQASNAVLLLTHDLIQEHILWSKCLNYVKFSVKRYSMGRIDDKSSLV